MKKKTQIKVTLTFLYDKVKGKDNDYYRDKAFNEIYNSDDTISDFDVEEVKE